MFKVNLHNNAMRYCSNILIKSLTLLGLVFGGFMSAEAQEHIELASPNISLCPYGTGRPIGAKLGGIALNSSDYGWSEAWDLSTRKPITEEQAQRMYDLCYNFRPCKIELFVVWADGTHELVDEIDNYTAGPGGLSQKGYIGHYKGNAAKIMVQYRYSSQNQVYGGSTTSTAVGNSSRLFAVNINPEVDDELVESYRGQTMYIRFSFSKRATGSYDEELEKTVFDAPIEAVVDYYFEPVSVSDGNFFIEDDSDGFVYDWDDSYFKVYCPGETAVPMVITNDEDLYLDENGDPATSYLGNTYHASYSWARSFDSWGRTLKGVATDVKSYLDLDVPNMAKSGRVNYVPQAVIYRTNRNDGCSVGFYGNGYNLFLNTNLVLSNSFFNTTSGASAERTSNFVVCYDDEVEYYPVFDMDGIEMTDDIDWFLYEIDGDGNIIKTIVDGISNTDQPSVELGHMKATTKYRLVAEYVDPEGHSKAALVKNGDLDENDCKSQKEFTIEVREVTAAQQIIFQDAPVCDESSHDVKFIVNSIPASSVASDYAYRFFTSEDGGASYDAFGTSNDYYDDLDWTLSSGSGWKNPLDGITVKDENVVRPDGGVKQYVFQLANTYTLNGEVYFCPMEIEEDLDIQDLPVLEDPDEFEHIVVCKDQPIQFSVVLDDISNDNRDQIADGLTYELFEDAECTVPASDPAVVIASGNIDMATWVISKASKDKYQFWAQVTNNATGCKSHPVYFEITALPVPVLTNVQASDPSYCHRDPAAADVVLTVETDPASNFDTFDYASVGLSKPDLVYYWNWTMPNGDKKSAVSFDPELSNATVPDVFDEYISERAGNIKFKVFAVEQDRFCGSILDSDLATQIYDPETEPESASAVTPAEGVLVITELAKFTMEKDVYACADAGSLSVELKSLDSRELTFEFSPTGKAPSLSNSPVVVPGNGSADFTVNFEESIVSKITQFKYNVYIEDNTALKCSYDTTLFVTIHPVPALKPVDPMFVCKNQPVEFFVSLDSYTASVIKSEGVNYNIYTDEACTAPATDLVMMQKSNTTTTDASIFTNTKNTTVGWGITSATADKYEYYVQVTNNTTGCKSHPLKIEIHVLPIPALSNVVATEASYCLHDEDVKNLEVSVDVDSKFESYDYAALGLSKPELLFYWNWTTPVDGNKYSAVTNVNKLSNDVIANTFGSEIAAHIGDVEFYVFAIDQEHQCGANQSFSLSEKYDPSTNPVEASAAERAYGKVEITDLAKFSMGKGVYACADGGSLSVELASLNSRELTFEFSPVGGAPSVTNSPVVVPGNGKADFTVNFDESVVSKITDFTYDVHITDNTALKCPYDTTLVITIHPLPALKAVKPIAVCYNQPVEFFVNLSDYTASVIPAEGVSYALYADEACTTPASGVVLMSKTNTVTSDASLFNATKRKSAGWGIENATADKYVFYAQVTNELTGCKSHPTKIEINVVPVPNVTNFVADKSAYCLNNPDAQNLVVSVELDSKYSSFDFSAIGLAQPDVTYHWSWAHENGSIYNEDIEVVNNGSLSAAIEAGIFDDIASVAGNVNFSVYATNSLGCGIDLDFDTKVPSDHGNSVLSPVTGIVTINTLPEFDIEEGVIVCADAASASVKVASLDGRKLTFEFVPVDGAPAPDVVKFSVEGNSSAYFSASFDPSTISDVTTFKYNVRVTDDSALECYDDAELSFVVHPIPTLEMLPALDDRHFCVGSTFNYSVNPVMKVGGKAYSAKNFSYAWTIDGNPSVSTQKGAWATELSTTPGVHKLAVTVSYVLDGVACSKTEEIDVYANTLPEFDFKDDVTICEGETTTLDALITNSAVENHLADANVYSYTLTPAEVSKTVAADTYSAQFEVAPVKTQVYTLAVANTATGCDALATKSVTVTVKRQAHIKLTKVEPAQVCAGVQTVVFNYSIVNPSEFDALDFSTIKIGDATVVEHDGSTITVSGNFENTGAAQISLKFDDSNCDGKTTDGCDVVFDAGTSLKVNPVPAAPTNITEPADHEICRYESTTLTYKVNKPTAGFVYEWYLQNAEPSASDVPFASTNSSSPNLVIKGDVTSALESSTKVWVRVIDKRSGYTTGCPSAYTNFDIIVNQLPDPVIPPVADICEDESTSIVVANPLKSAEASYNYIFTDPKGKATTIAASELGIAEEPVYSTVELTATSTYYVVVEHVETGCRSISLPVVINVNKRPIPETQVAYEDGLGSSSILLPSGSSVERKGFCYGEDGKATVKISATTQSGAGVFTSTLVSVSDGSVSDWTKVSEDTYTCSKNWTAETTLTFTIKDENCVSSEFSATVLVVEPLVTPVLHLNSEADEVCQEEDQDIILTIDTYADRSNKAYVVVWTKNGVEKQWISDNDIVDGVQYVGKTSTTELGIDANTDFYVYVFDKRTGCVSAKSNVVSIVVNELPVPVIISSDADNVICPGEDVVLSSDKDYVSYLWLDGEINGETTKSVTVNPTSTSSYRLQVTDEKGCVSHPTEQFTITVKPRPVFTLEASPALVCQGSTTEVEIIPSQVNGLGSADNLTFVEPYTFTSPSSTTAVVSAVDQGDGTFKYIVSGHEWSEASVTFTAKILSSTDDNSCWSEDVPVTVDVVSALAQPVAFSTNAQDHVTQTKTVHVCYGTTESVTAYIDNVSAYPTVGGVSYTYHWFSDAAGTVELVDGTDYSVDYNKGTITFVPSGSISLYAKAYRETDPKCESPISEVVSIIMEDLPLAPVAMVNMDHICVPSDNGLSVEFQIESPAVDCSYIWFTSDGNRLLNKNLSGDAALLTGVGTAPATMSTDDFFAGYGSAFDVVEVYAHTVNQYGCVSEGHSNIVTVDFKQNPYIASGDEGVHDICAGESKVFSVNERYYHNEKITFNYVRTVAEDPSVYETGSFATSDDGVGYLELSDVESSSVSTTQTWLYEIKAVLYNGCESTNSIKFETVVHAKPSFVATATPAVCEGDVLTLSLNGVQSNDGNSGLHIKVVSADGSFSDEKDVLNGSNYSVDVESVRRSMLPFSYQIEELDATSYCEVSGEFVFVLNDIPEFNITNLNGEEDQTPGTDVVTLDYCLDEPLTLTLAEALPAVDNNGTPTSYTYQWQKNGVDIVGEISETFSIAKLNSGDEALYTLVVTSNGCNFTRSAQINVHDEPVPVIVTNDKAIYCLDGELKVSTEDEYVAYRWDLDLPDGTSETNVASVRDLVYSLEGKGANGDLLGINVYVTDKFGCSNSVPTNVYVELSTPPAISNIYGTESCGDTPFVITVEQDKADYKVELLNVDLTENASVSVDAEGHVITTSADFPEGEYLLVVTDLHSDCTTSQEISLVRYDLNIDINVEELTCENANVDFAVELSDNNGHDDFLSKVSNIKYSITYLDKDKNVVFSESDIDNYSLSLSHSFSPLATGLVASLSDEYYISVTVSYQYNSDINGTSTCEISNTEKIYIVPTPVLTVSPAMPSCLGTEFVFTVDPSNVASATPSYTFFINGVEVEGHDNSSNVLSLADFPAIELVQGDIVTAKVDMFNSTICASNAISVDYFGDFKAALSADAPGVVYCKGADIPFSLTSVMPDGVADDFVLNKIKEYTLFYSDGSMIYKKNVDPVELSVSDVFQYHGDDDVISVYAVVIDEFGCQKTTEVVDFNIKQFKVTAFAVVDAASATLMLNPVDLCANNTYWFTPQLVDNNGNLVGDDVVDGEYGNYEYYYFVDDVAVERPDALDPVLKYAAPAEGDFNIRVEVLSLLTGCKIELGSVEYPAYEHTYHFHDLTNPNEKLKDEDLLPVSSDPDDARTFEICFNDTFAFDVTNSAISDSYISVMFDEVRVANYYSNGKVVVLDESTIPASQIVSNFVGNIGSFEFSIDPSADFHTIQFIVNDGSCEVFSDEWKFRMHEDVTLTAVDENGNDVLLGDEVIVCVGQTVEFTPSTSEPNYLKGYNVTLDGVAVDPADFSMLAYTFEALDPAANHILTFAPDFGANVCEKVVTVKVNEAPKPAASFFDADDVEVVPSASDLIAHEYLFERCEQLPSALKLSGAANYIVSLDIDGVSSDAKIVGAQDGSDFVIETPYIFDAASAEANGVDYNDYVYNVTYQIGNCLDYGKVTVRVYQTPDAEFINNTPRSLVIAGTKVPVEVTPGFQNYDFIINGVSVQSSASNVLAAEDNVVTIDSTTIEVVVTSEHGCVKTLEALVRVLENIDPKDVTASAEFYCSEDDGVVISVVDPQPGVTYVLNKDEALFSPVTCVPGEPVEWTSVKVPAGEVSHTYYVEAYYDALPEESVEMNNTVSVEVVKTPSDASLPYLYVNDCEKVLDPTFSWTLSNAEFGTAYFLTRDGEILSSAHTTASADESEIVFNIYDIMLPAGGVSNGEYRILARTVGSNDSYVCEVVLDDALVVDLPTTKTFDVYSNPANGKYCVDDINGVDIVVSGSDFSADFDHEYALMLDGVEYAAVARVKSDIAQGEITFKNVRLPEGVHSASFAVVCFFNGCQQPMNNTVTINAIEHPENQTLSVSNYGIYCADENGVTITVGGQEEGYLYTLYRNGAKTEFSHLGDDSAAEFYFENVLEEGTYSVVVTIPDLGDRAETSCTTTLEQTVNVYRSELPADVNITIANRVDKSYTVCLGDGGTDIFVLNPEVYVEGSWSHDYSVHYELYDQDGNLVSALADGIESSSDLSFKGIDPTVSGTYVYSVLAVKTIIVNESETVECSRWFDDAVTLEVLERPNTGETIAQDVPADKIAEDACYGVDIIVENPNTADSKIFYLLYLLDADNNIAGLPVDTIYPSKGEDRFLDLRDRYGVYQVYASNGACKDLVGETIVALDKYPKVQTLVMDGNVCQGDPGVPVRLADSEANVIYSLFYVAPGASKPGVKISTFTTTEDHQDVRFTNLTYADGSVTDLVSIDGSYYVSAVKIPELDPNGCEVVSPSVGFQTLRLPKSYRLLARHNVFCGDETGVKLYLENSEVSPDALITYRLYSKDADDNLTYVQEVIGNGEQLEFLSIVGEGTYVAIALKEFYADGHICTSSMEGEVVIARADRPQDVIALGDDNSVEVCGSDVATFSVTDPYLVAGVTYYVVPQGAKPDEVAGVYYDGTNAVNFSGLVDGVNEIYASYDNMACIERVGSVTVNRFASIPSYIVNETLVACGEEDATLSIESSKLADGATYAIFDENGVELMSVVFNAATDTHIEFSNIPEGSYTIKACYDVNDEDLCNVTVGKLVVRTHAAIIATNFEDSEFSCGSDPMVYDLVKNHASELVAGATYYVVEDGVIPSAVNASGVTFNGGESLAFANLYPGNYDVYASFENYDCLVKIGDLAVAASEINLYGLSASESCDEKYTFELDGSDVGAVYSLIAHFADGVEAPIDGALDIVGDGNPIAWTGLTMPTDVNYVFVHSVIGECDVNTANKYISTIVPKFDFYTYPFTTNAAGACAGQAVELTIGGSDPGVTYYLTKNGEDERIEEWVGDGDAHTWYPTGEGIVTYYLHAINGICSADMWKPVTIDFDATIAPDGMLTLYVQGVAYTSASSDIPEVCPGSNVLVSAMVNGANVKSFKFYRNGDLMYEGASNTFIPFNAKEDLSGQVTVKFGIVTTVGCEFLINDSVSFFLRNDLADEVHLIAKEGSVERENELVGKYQYVEYCEGDLGAKLGYVNYAEPGYIYRLYQVGDSLDANNPAAFDHLLDIQELPSYINELGGFSPADTLFFNGWGYGSAGDYAAYAKDGWYYIMAQNQQGCNLKTNYIHVHENPLPIAASDTAFFAVVIKDINGKDIIDYSSTSQEFGLVDAGYMILSNARAGIHYQLVNVDNSAVLVDTTLTHDVDFLMLGPVLSAKQDSIDNHLASIKDSKWGEGNYTIEALNPLTGCSSTIGDIIFVDEELIAYNVEIYLNKGETTRVTSLVPSYGYKSTKRYISWSSKIDHVYLPVLDTAYYRFNGQWLVDEMATRDLDYGEHSGYVNTVEKSNIRFQIVPKYDAVGQAGLLNVNYTSNDTALISINQNTGWFQYQKKPSFYGQEQFQYYIYNTSMPNRVSNVATITVLCGNEDTGDDESVFLIPNAFSPNGDGLNDYFEIIIPDKYKEKSVSKLQVFNRWGTLVYRSSGLQYGLDCPYWDGNSSSSNMVTVGSQLPSGTYYYIFTVTFIDNLGHQIERKMHGYIELRR